MVAVHFSFRVFAYILIFLSFPFILFSLRFDLSFSLWFSFAIIYSKYLSLSLNWLIFLAPYNIVLFSLFPSMPSIKYCLKVSSSILSLEQYLLFYKSTRKHSRCCHVSHDLFVNYLAAYIRIAMLFWENSTNLDLSRSTQTTFQFLLVSFLQKETSGSLSNTRVALVLRVIISIFRLE